MFQPGNRPDAALVASRAAHVAGFIQRLKSDSAAQILNSLAHLAEEEISFNEIELV